MSAHKVLDKPQFKQKLRIIRSYLWNFPYLPSWLVRGKPHRVLNLNTSETDTASYFFAVNVCPYWLTESRARIHSSRNSVEKDKPLPGNIQSCVFDTGPASSQGIAITLRCEPHLLENVYSRYQDWQLASYRLTFDVRPDRCQIPNPRSYFSKTNFSHYFTIAQTSFWDWLHINHGQARYFISEKKCSVFHTPLACVLPSYVLGAWTKWIHRLGCRSQTSHCNTQWHSRPLGM